MENTITQINNGGKNMNNQPNNNSMKNMEKTNNDNSMENMEKPNKENNSMEESTANGGMNTSMQNAPLYGEGSQWRRMEKWEEIFNSPIRYDDGPVWYKGQWHKWKNAK